MLRYITNLLVMFLSLKSRKGWEEVIINPAKTRMVRTGEDFGQIANDDLFRFRRNFSTCAIRSFFK